jgi:hypothetical protein
MMVVEKGKCKLGWGCRSGSRIERAANQRSSIDQIERAKQASLKLAAGCPPLPSDDKQAASNSSRACLLTQPPSSFLWYLLYTTRAINTRVSPCSPPHARQWPSACAVCRKRAPSQSSNKQHGKNEQGEKSRQWLRRPQTAKPTVALMPFTRIASIHNSSSKSASQMERPGLVKGNPGTPPPMKKGLPTNVPLPSQEGKQGVMQYAL